MSKKCRICESNDATETAQFQTTLDYKIGSLDAGDIYNQTEKFKVCEECSLNLLNHILNLIKLK